MSETHTHARTHTRLTALFPGLSRWAGTRKVKPIWILLKQETVSGNGISWAICKSALRSRQITTPETHHSVFYRPDALPATQQTASKYWMEMSENCQKKYFKIGKHLAKLQTTWLIVSYVPFALDFCPQRYRMLIGRLMWVYYQQISNCCRPVFTYWLDRLTPSVTNRLLIVYGILLQHLFLCYSTCIQPTMGFLYD